MPPKAISNAITIADALLKIAKRQGKGLTPMQLVKLTYIAHGFALAVLDRDLFDDKIEAWKYGPVIPNLYHATKKFGRNPIGFSMIDDAEIDLPDDVCDFLEEVFNKYGSLSGIQLSDLTHRIGSPWHQVYQGDRRGLEIPDDLIKEHYRKLYEANRAA